LFHEKQIAIIGGGPAAFLLAAFRSSKNLHTMKKNKTAGRKFWLLVRVVST
jgi:predicted flavoprotein YhiN